MLVSLFMSSLTTGLDPNCVSTPPTLPVCPPSVALSVEDLFHIFRCFSGVAFILVCLWEEMSLGPATLSFSHCPKTSLLNTLLSIARLVNCGIRIET